MKYLLSKDRFKRLDFYNIEKRYIVLKCILSNRKIKSQEKKRVYLSMYNLISSNSSFVRTKNRCIFTNRAKSVYRVFKVSRIIFRDLASKGFFSGVRKASW